MSEGPHEKRLKEGLAGMIVLGLAGIVLYACKLVVERMVLPNIEFVQFVGIRIAALFICAYVLGYIVTDLPDDIREVLGE